MDSSYLYLEFNVFRFTHLRQSPLHDCGLGPRPRGTAGTTVFMRVKNAASRKLSEASAVTRGVSVLQVGGAPRAVPALWLRVPTLSASALSFCPGTLASTHLESIPTHLSNPVSWARPFLTSQLETVFSSS